MSAVMTYNSLLEDVKNYVDRTDPPFVDQIPSLITLAENRIATEIHALGYKKFVTVSLEAGITILSKPTTWRETVSFAIGVGEGNRSHKYLLYRGYQYCRTYWKDSTKLDEPRFYSDYDFDHWLIVPTPDFDYPAEIEFHERPLPLSEENQQNWSTMFAPQLILYATLLEAQPFLMRPERTVEFQQLYQRSADAIMNEEKRRLIDDSTSRKQGT
jgi:hypothetical protein